MTILVTGGSGFIGSHVLEVLQERGHKTTNVDRRAPRSDRGRFIMGDIRKVAAEAVRDVEAVIHCAAHADISENWKDVDQRFRLWEDNCQATFELFEAIPEHTAVLFVSSACVYGSGGPHDEYAMTRATSPYAATKLAGEALLQAYALKRGWRPIIVRPVSCVGARYKHGHIADFVRMAQECGEIYPLDNGLHGKSFVHVRDVAERIVTLVESPTACGAHNLADARGVWGWPDTVGVMGAMTSPLKVKAPSHVESGWIGDPIALTVKSIIPWTPKRTVMDGVRETLDSLGWGRKKNKWRRSAT